MELMEWNRWRVSQAKFYIAYIFIVLTRALKAQKNVCDDELPARLIILNLR